MCGSIADVFTGGSGGSSQAGAARRANAQQQAAIDQGMQQINAIYGGGSYPVYSQAGEYSPGQQYYTNKNGTYTPYAGPAARGAKLVGKGKLFGQSPSQTFTGYGNNFFNQRANAYQDYELPQLGQQYQTTKNSLNFNLANRGLLGGSVANQETNDLNLTMGQQKQGIADAGQQQAQQLKSDVQNSKLQAISQLYQTADPAQAQQTALADASRFTAPSSFAPLANGFANLVNQYSLNQQIAGYQQQPGYGSYSPYGQYSSPQAQALPGNY